MARQLVLTQTIDLDPDTNSHALAGELEEGARDRATALGYPSVVTTALREVPSGG
jgi:hypothetical protein